MFDAIPHDLSEEQRMFRDVLRRAARERLGAYTEESDREHFIAEDAIRIIDELGLYSMSVPADLGGLGADLTAECLAVEELGYAFPAAALTIGPGIVLSHIFEAASPCPARETYLRRLTEPRTLAAIALTEADAGSDSAAITTHAKKVDDGYLLNGTKIYVSNGGVAEFYCVFARTGKTEDQARGISAFMVEKDAVGLNVTRVENKMGIRGSQTAEVVLHDVFVPDDALVGEVNQAFKYIMKAFDLSRPLMGALALGVARSAFDVAAEYAAKRKQFGKVIAEFQGIQFMLADMAISIESGRSLIYNVAKMDNVSPEEFSAYAAMAKTYATDVAMSVTSDAVQILGGAGYTDQYPVERMMRDVKIFQIFEGTNQIQRMIIGRHINESMRISS